MKHKKDKDRDGMVYSTDPAFLKKSKPEADASSHSSASSQDLRIWVQSHKGGKKATVIRGFEGSEKELEELARTLKVKCSTGGAAKDGEIILNGDLRQRVGEELKKLGMRFKFSGG